MYLSQHQLVIEHLQVLRVLWQCHQRCDPYLVMDEDGELLRMLCEYKNDLLPRELALKKIWGSDTYFNGRSMDVYIAKLRKYLKEDPAIEIVNIHGNGFRLVVTE